MFKSLNIQKGIKENEGIVHLILPKWSGQISYDGKYGLYAPTRGGLEIFEFRNGKV
ncbi:unnamed protein product, partial [Rotaria magnacalcarata]